MIGPVNFTPISEVAFKAGNLPGFTPAALHDQLTQLPIFLTNHDGTERRVDVRVLAQQNGKYVFISEPSWIVRGISDDMPKIDITEAIRGDRPMLDASEDIRGDMNLYAGGFTAIDVEYDERLRAALMPTLLQVDQVEAFLSDLRTSGGADHMLAAIDFAGVEQLEAYAGMPLCLRDSDAELVLSDLQEGLPPSNKFKTQLDAVAAFRKWIQNAPQGRPRKEGIRKKWAEAAGIGRDRAREIWKEEKPIWEASFLNN